MSDAPITPIVIRRPTGRRAQSTVEFALIAWPFFLLVLACTDWAQFFFYEHSLRYALAEAGRFATPGTVIYTQSLDIYGPTNCVAKSTYQTTELISRYESIRRTYSNSCAMNMPATNLVALYQMEGMNENDWLPGPGGANDKIKLTVTYKLKLITPVAVLIPNNSSYSNGVYTIRVQSIFLNEPSANFSNYTNYYNAEPHPTAAF